MQEQEKQPFTKQKTWRKNNVLKIKTKGTKNSSGRNSSGRITAFHRGGGHKRKYRLIDFFRYKASTGIVCSVEYDPNRNSFISAVYDYIDNYFYYILTPKNLNVGDVVQSGPYAEPRLGNSLPLDKIPLGSYIHSFTLTEKGCAKIARSAGMYAIVKEKTLTEVTVKLKSGKVMRISPKCYGSMGIVSNKNKNLQPKYKAGQSRWLNKRPTVRGVAMNPIDHPHGGGEGKKSGLNKTPWGKFNQRGATSKLTNYTNKARNE
jgi:large subunit ribosomal protein L2